MHVGYYHEEESIPLTIEPSAGHVNFPLEVIIES